MRHFAHQLRLRTNGRGTHEITDRIRATVGQSEVQSGLCTVFVHHTSASLIVCENADPSVLADLERFMARLVRDGDPMFAHDDEGPDDMPAHVRSVLTATSMTLPITAGRLDLGTWQGVFLWEHRHAPHDRRITLTVIGD